MQRSYDSQAELRGWSKKRINDILGTKSNNERLYYVLKKQGFIHTELTVFVKDIAKEGGIIKLLKKLKVYKMRGTRSNKVIWCDPYIWMLAALELHPEIYAITVIWLADKLIINRIEAGNFYKGLTKAVSKFKKVNYVQMAKGLNFIIFNRHEPNIRNLATEQQLKDLENLERNIAFSIDMGYITNFKGLIKQLYKLYDINHRNL